MMLSVSTVRVFFCKQKTAYEMRISEWSSDVCSSDLGCDIIADRLLAEHGIARRHPAIFEIVIISRQRRCIAREAIRVQTRERVGLPAALHKGEVGGEKLGARARKAVELSFPLNLGAIGLKHRDTARLIPRRRLPRGAQN